MKLYVSETPAACSEAPLPPAGPPVAPGPRGLQGTGPALKSLRALEALHGPGPWALEAAPEPARLELGRNQAVKGTLSLHSRL